MYSAGSEPQIIIPALYGLSVSQLSHLAGRPHWGINVFDIFQNATGRSTIRILGANGPITLPIPVKRYAKGTPTSDIQIDYMQKWQNRHWRSLQSAYGKSPFFEYYKAELEALFYQNPTLLVDFTVPVLKWIHSQYFPGRPATVILAHEAENFQPENELHLSVLANKHPETKPWKYTQVFGQDFVPGLSVLDALFCAGPNLKSI